MDRAADGGQGGAFRNAQSSTQTAESDGGSALALRRISNLALEHQKQFESQQRERDRERKSISQAHHHPHANLDSPRRVRKRSSRLHTSAAGEVPTMLIPAAGDCAPSSLRLTSAAAPRSPAAAVRVSTAPATPTGAGSASSRWHGNLLNILDSERGALEQPPRSYEPAAQTSVFSAALSEAQPAAPLPRVAQSQAGFKPALFQPLQLPTSTSPRALEPLPHAHIMMPRSATRSLHSPMRPSLLSRTSSALRRPPLPPPTTTVAAAAAVSAVSAATVTATAAAAAAVDHDELNGTRKAQHTDFVELLLSESRLEREWTAEEDDCVLDVVRACGAPVWEKIVHVLPWRSREDITRRWESSLYAVAVREGIAGLAAPADGADADSPELRWRQQQREEQLRVRSLGASEPPPLHSREPENRGRVALLRASGGAAALRHRSLSPGRMRFEQNRRRIEHTLHASSRLLNATEVAAGVSKPRHSRARWSAAIRARSLSPTRLARGAPLTADELLVSVKLHRTGSSALAARTPAQRALDADTLQQAPMDIEAQISGHASMMD